MEIQSSESVEPAYIKSQQRLGDCGQADIRIDSPALCMVVEIKTESARALGSRQQLQQAQRGYLKWLRENAKVDAETVLAYLVPARWKYSEDTRDELAELNQTQIGSVKIKIETWERVAALIPTNRSASAISIVEDFRLLLNERFGPTMFAKEETKIMFSQELPAETLLKTISLIYDVALRLDPKAKLEILKDEFGFYVRKGDKQGRVFYVGWWLTVWEQKHSPLCFGVKCALPNEKAAFARSLHESFHEQEPIDDGDWLVGFVPERDIYSPGADAVISISGKIKRVFDSI